MTDRNSKEWFDRYRRAKDIRKMEPVSEAVGRALFAYRKARDDAKIALVSISILRSACPHETKEEVTDGSDLFTACVDCLQMWEEDGRKV